MKAAVIINTLNNSLWNSLTGLFSLTCSFLYGYQHLADGVFRNVGIP